MATNADFIKPQGDLTTDLFPGEVLTDLVDAWITQAEAKTVSLPASLQEAGIKHWVYYRGYNTIAHRLAGTPNSVSMAGLSQGIGSDRLNFFVAKAKEELDAYKLVVASVTPAGDARSQTKAVRTEVGF